MKTPTAPQPGYPVTANWGREVADSLRRMRLQAGPGIRLSQTPEGTTITAPPPPPREEPDLPMPFDVQATISSGSAALRIYIVNKDEIVTRNGHAVPAEAGIVGEGWEALDSVSASGIVFVWLTLDAVSSATGPWYAGQADVEWSLATGAALPSLDAAAERQQTPTLIAVIVDGVVNQVRHGCVATFYDAPDSETPEPLMMSLGHSGNGAGQLFGFDSQSGKKLKADLVAATLRDFVLRFGLSDGTTRIVYCDGEEVADYVFPQDTETMWDVYYNATSKKLVQYKAKWDVENREFVKDTESAPSEIVEIPSPDGLQDETWIWGRVAYDSTYNKFVQYKLIWDSATRTFSESETATDIIALDSHSSQHI